ncbi:MAG: pseudaminic acid biosynthesis-associated methylase [Flaviaesturariibacter sp.]|nr:pseudaminic acid biosynthesis-associated methylase [Flaviaesturariibacter sp.]
MADSYHPEMYWDEVAQNIENRKEGNLIAGDDEPYYRYKRKQFLKVLDGLNFKNKTVLEIGSGPGGNLHYIHAKGCRKITGVDISGSMISLAKNFLAGKDIDLFKINGSKLPFDDGAFNIVFTSTVLQHITDENVLNSLIAEIGRVSNSEIYLFERIERSIKGHESNLGRPVSYYAALLYKHGFHLVQSKPLPIYASYYACGAIRKVFNSKPRKEGEPLSKLSIRLEQLALPVTAILDKFIPNNRDVTLLHFSKEAAKP